MDGLSRQPRHNNGLPRSPLGEKDHDIVTFEGARIEIQTLTSPQPASQKKGKAINEWEATATSATDLLECHAG